MIGPWAPPKPGHKKTWIEVLALDEHDAPLAEEPYKLVLPDGEVREGKLEKDGSLRLVDVLPGECVLSFPEREEVEPAVEQPKVDTPAAIVKKTWIELVLVNEDGQPVGAQAYKLALSDGTVQEGTLGEDGRVWIDDIPEGDCSLSFPDLDLVQQQS